MSFLPKWWRLVIAAAIAATLSMTMEMPAEWSSGSGAPVFSAAKDVGRVLVVRADREGSAVGVLELGQGKPPPDTTALALTPTPRATLVDNFPPQTRAPLPPRRQLVGCVELRV